MALVAAAVQRALETKSTTIRVSKTPRKDIVLRIGLNFIFYMRRQGIAQVFLSAPRPIYFSLASNSGEVGVEALLYLRVISRRGAFSVP